jgi:hypothetical protein
MAVWFSSATVLAPPPRLANHEGHQGHEDTSILVFFVSFVVDAASCCRAGFQPVSELDRFPTSCKEPRITRITRIKTVHNQGRTSMSFSSFSSFVLFVSFVVKWFCSPRAVSRAHPKAGKTPALRARPTNRHLQGVANTPRNNPIVDRPAC